MEYFQFKTQISSQAIKNLGVTLIYIFVIVITEIERLGTLRAIIHAIVLLSFSPTKLPVPLGHKLCLLWTKMKEQLSCWWWAE